MWTVVTVRGRARHLDSQYATQQAIVQAARAQPSDSDADFRLWVTAGACLSALHSALVRWVEEDGRADLPGLLDAALTAVFDNHFP